MATSTGEQQLTMPDTFDAEVLNADVLAMADVEASLPSEREHVTPWVTSAAASIRWIICTTNRYGSVTGSQWIIRWISRWPASHAAGVRAMLCRSASPAPQPAATRWRSAVNTAGTTGIWPRTSRLVEHLLPGLTPNGLPSALAVSVQPFSFNPLD